MYDCFSVRNVSMSKSSFLYKNPCFYTDLVHVFGTCSLYDSNVLISSPFRVARGSFPRSSVPRMISYNHERLQAPSLSRFAIKCLSPRLSMKIPNIPWRVALAFDRFAEKVLEGAPELSTACGRRGAKACFGFDAWGLESQGYVD